MNEASPWFRWERENLILEVRVQPRASRNEISGTHHDRLKVRVTAAPVEGAANRRLVTLFAREFHVPKSHVHIEAGAGAREKRLVITSPRVLPAWLNG